MRILITGAGSGFGKAIATRYAAAGWRVLVSDVDLAAAEAVAKDLNQHALALDVTSDDAWAAAEAWCQREWGGLDVLVNNAGVAAGGRFDRITMADWDWIWEINLKGVVRGCATFVPRFKEQGSGHLVPRAGNPHTSRRPSFPLAALPDRPSTTRYEDGPAPCQRKPGSADMRTHFRRGALLNVASLAGIMNLPAMSSYNVTKAGVISLSETLRHELTPYGVHTTVVCPAFVRTNLGDRMRSPDPEVAVLMERLMKASTVTPEDVANQVFDAVARKRFLVLTHKDGRRSALFKRFLPSVVDRQVATYWNRLRSTVEGQ